MCNSGDVNVLQWNREWFFSRRVKLVWLWVQRDGGFSYEVSWHGPEVIFRFTGIRIRVLRWWKRPFWFSKIISLTFSSNWVIPYQGGCSQFLISSNKFYSPICDWKMNFPFSLGNMTSFALSLFSSRFPMRPSFPTPQCLRLSFQIDGFLTGFSQK